MVKAISAILLIALVLFAIGCIIIPACITVISMIRKIDRYKRKKVVVCAIFIDIMAILVLILIYLRLIPPISALWRTMPW